LEIDFFVLKIFFGHIVLQEITFRKGAIYMKAFKEFILNYVCGDIKKIFERVDERLFQVSEEVRIRRDKPLYLRNGGKEFFLSKSGICSSEEAYIPKREDINSIMEFISRFSVYAFEEEIRQGFIPLPKGVRVGICGKAVVENGIVKTIKNVSALNFRIPREVIGCSDSVIDFITYPRIFHTLIVSPPCCGKTTLLRDIIRSLSNGVKNKFAGVNVGVADERSEIAGTFFGKEQNDLGIRTDVIDGGKKEKSIYMLLRAMAPQVIAFDEIGSVEEVLAVCDAVNSGVKIICTIHSEGIDDLKTRYIFQKIYERNIFERYIVLSNLKGPGTIEGVYNQNFEKISISLKKNPGRCPDPLLS